ncbi:MAG: RNA polymerase sigma factor, partial [Ruminococcus sp.]|nr:RNA polymerase sigma factor [Candidatus Apopatosoma intestinale]
MEKEITKYAEYLLAVAMKKCGNISDAEDLTQDTLLAAIQFTNRGGKIENIKYWLTSVLSNKWNGILRKKYHLPLVSIDMIPEIEDTDYDTDAPSAEQIRREVAYLAELQRDVITKHYLEGKKVQDIADEMGVPKGTVLSRLSSGREQIRKGLDSMEQYEKQSYQPERLDIGCHGCSGFHDEPWSLVADNLMKQNILIVAYEKPLTVVEIAHSLGIPTAYIENAVSELTQSELMRQTGNKYYTDFMIVTPEQHLKGLDAEISLAEAHYGELLQTVNNYLTALS